MPRLPEKRQPCGTFLGSFWVQLGDPETLAVFIRVQFSVTHNATRLFRAPFFWVQLGSIVPLLRGKTRHSDCRAFFF